jgi:UV DNA damage endonuclease
VRPIVHWSESQAGRKPLAHSDYVEGPITFWGRETEVDCYIEAKAKDRALLHYRDLMLAHQPRVA